MTICYLGLGSNLRTPTRQIRQALHALIKQSKISVLRISPLLNNAAVGRRAQPPYCNCVVKIKTTISPQTLLRQCQYLEKRQGRVRKFLNGSRTLDIDILLYGQRSIRQHNLHIPHPRMFERSFVMIPLLNIAPNIYFPVN